MLKASAISANQQCTFSNGRIKNENVNRLMFEVARCAALSLLFPRSICQIHTHIHQAKTHLLFVKRFLCVWICIFGTSRKPKLQQQHNWLLSRSKFAYLNPILYTLCSTKHCFNFGNILIRGFFKRKSFSLPLCYSHLIHSRPPECMNGIGLR